MNEFDPFFKWFVLAIILIAVIFFVRLRSNRKIEEEHKWAKKENELEQREEDETLR